MLTQNVRSDQNLVTDKVMTTRIFAKRARKIPGDKTVPCPYTVSSMEFSQQEILQWFGQYAYEPELVYGAVICLMIASSFGFPVPEEVTLVSLGLVTYMARHPDLFPPPYAGAEGVQAISAAIVAFLAVFFSDFLVFYLGRKFGGRITGSARFQKMMKPSVRDRIQSWTEKYGALACGIFRFTPGLRFPGHLACGLIGIPTWKFALVDGTAALLSVPTQVLILAYYGDTILDYLKQFKIALGVILAVIVAIVLIRNQILARRTAKDSNALTQT